MSRLQMIRAFLSYYWSADSYYQLHSPFLFEFTKKVLEDGRFFYTFGEIETLRKLLLQDKTVIEVKDYGAGSSTQMNARQRSIAEIAKNSLSGPQQCRQLFRIVNYLKPQKMLELGTSLGVSTLYLRGAARKAELITLEGCPEISARARKHFKKCKASDIELMEGRFQVTLPLALEQLGQVDIVFIDGHHLKDPTLAYFESCLPYAHDNTLFIFDDIHWSEEMEAAWANIQQDPRIQLTVDLFRMGLAFIRPAHKVKEHYVLAPKLWKPWKVLTS